MAKKRKLPRKPPAAITSAGLEAMTPETTVEASSVMPAAKKTVTFWMHGMVAALLVVLCGGLYGWTTNFPMVFDDILYLENNPLVKEARSFDYLADFKNFANKPTQMGLEPDLATNFILRPVAYATFHLNYVLDEFNPRGFRMVNILCHLGNGLLVYMLVHLLLRGRHEEGAPTARSTTFIAATAAVLFTVHPMATESVTYIAQRFTSMGTFFYLLALVLYFWAATLPAKGWRWTVRGGAVLVTLLGMLTKECNFTVPVMAVALDWVVRGTPLRGTLKHALPMLLCMPLIPVQVLLVSWAQNDANLDFNHAVNITNIKDMPWDHGHFALTQLTVVLSYLRRIFWPVELNLDPEWPLYRSLLDGPVLGALLVFGLMLGGAWFFYQRRHGNKAFGLAAMALLWFFATIVPSSGLVPLPDLMAEHRAYLPSVGIFIALAILLEKARQFSLRLPRAAWATPALCVLGAAAFTWATVERNRVWSTAVSLWEDTTRKSPGKQRAWNNLGAAYEAVGRNEDALRALERAIEIEPKYEMPYLNLAKLNNSLGRHKDAMRHLEALVRVNPRAEGYLELQYHYAVGLIGTNEVDRGVRVLEEIVNQVPGHRPSHIMLGFVYHRNNMHRKALHFWRKAVTIAPPDAALATLLQQTEAAVSREALAGLGGQP